MKFEIKNAVQNFTFDTEVNDGFIRDWATQLLNDLKTSLKKYEEFAKVHKLDFSSITSYEIEGKQDPPILNDVYKKLDKLIDPTTFNHIEYATIHELNYISNTVGKYSSQCNDAMINYYKELDKIQIKIDWRKTFILNYFILLQLIIHVNTDFIVT